MLAQVPIQLKTNYDLNFLPLITCRLPWLGIQPLTANFSLWAFLRSWPFIGGAGRPSTDGSERKSKCQTWTVAPYENTDRNQGRTNLQLLFSTSHPPQLNSPKTCSSFSRVNYAQNHQQYTPRHVPTLFHVLLNNRNLRSFPTLNLLFYFKKPSTKSDHCSGHHESLLNFTSLHETHTSLLPAKSSSLGPLQTLPVPETLL